MSRNIRAQESRNRNKQPGVWLSAENQNENMKLSLEGLNIALTLIINLQGTHIQRQSCKTEKTEWLSFLGLRALTICDVFHRYISWFHGLFFQWSEVVSCIVCISNKLGSRHNKRCYQCKFIYYLQAYMKTAFKSNL